MKRKSLGCILEPAIGFVLILLTLWMMVSCKTVRQAEKTDWQAVSYSKSDIGMTYHGTERQDLLRSIWKEVRIDNAIESQVVIYDTSMKKDSVTGKHPVLAEIRVSSTTDIESCTADTTSNIISKESVSEMQIHNESQREDTLSAESKKESKPRSLWLDWMTIICIVVATILSFKYYSKN